MLHQNARESTQSYSFSFLRLFLQLLEVIFPSVIKMPQTISDNLNSTLNQHKANNNLTEYIFLNNFEICLLMFVPIVGVVLGLGILFNTGIALGAIAYVQGYPVA